MILLFMEYCASKQLRPKTMHAYEKTLRLFAKWLQENEEITNAVFEEFKELFADEFNFTDVEDEDALFTDAE